MIFIGKAESPSNPLHFYCVFLDLRFQKDFSSLKRSVFHHLARVSCSTYGDYRSSVQWTDHELLHFTAIFIQWNPHRTSKPRENIPLSKPGAARSEDILVGASSGYSLFSPLIPNRSPVIDDENKRILLSILKISVRLINRKLSILMPKLAARARAGTPPPPSSLDPSQHGGAGQEEGSLSETVNICFTYFYKLLNALKVQ